LGVQRIKGKKIDPKFSAAFAHEVVKKAREIVARTEHASKAVFTEFTSKCADVNERPAPYIRICDTDLLRASKIAKLIAAHLLVDIEIVELDGFREAPKSFE
jgi:hypothetical protein